MTFPISVGYIFLCSDLVFVPVGAGGDVKGQYAGCVASGQPLTEATRIDPFLRSGSMCAPLPASRRGKLLFVDVASSKSWIWGAFFFEASFRILALSACT